MKPSFSSRFLTACGKFIFTTGILSFMPLAFMPLGGCSQSGVGKGDSDSITATVEEHADNDIAMSVRSIIDAINVGQPLDSADYNFTGILTDGTGRPLYTDVQGTPGAWQVKVLTPNSAVISNLYLGDLLADELVQYLLTTLEIDDTPLIQAADKDAEHPAGLTVYSAGGSDLIIERQQAKAPNGSEGPLLKILIRKTELAPPSDSIPL